METKPSDVNELLPAVVDSQTLGELYDRHYELVLRYCHKRLYLHAVAEDITSSVFLRVAEHIRRFTGKTICDFRCWLYGIANHEIAAYLRKTSRRQFLFETACRTGELAESATEHPKENHQEQNLRKAMLELPPADQALLSLRYWENLSHDEIAHIVSLRNGTVRTRLSRALRRLRKLLQHATEDSR